MFVLFVYNKADVDGTKTTTYTHDSYPTVCDRHTVQHTLASNAPSHLRPCFTKPNSISPQKSQKCGDLYECTWRTWGRICSSSIVVLAVGNANKHAFVELDSLFVQPGSQPHEQSHSLSIVSVTQFNRQSTVQNSTRHVTDQFRDDLGSQSLDRRKNSVFPTNHATGTSKKSNSN